ncbi:hypothetical protein F7725_023108 [Dissostichus mawsoni]|uniref:Uncharacterized protein n=1 Tax=Dissostichus mawsoni TaxID=36200 RepID=A0A7J5Z0Q6_DISMA|nr:hypothetical protein F7725_023108 [Dissostichus mawsoni]
MGLLFSLGLPVVEVVEVGHNDRHWERNCQHSGDGTQRSYYLASYSDRHHVPIAHSCHRHNSPPKGVRDAAKVGSVLLCLGEVDSTGEQDDSNEQKEDQQSQLSHAGLERLPQNLQSFGVSRQLEDPEHSDQTDHPEYGQRCCLLPHSLFLWVFGQLCAECDEVRDDSHYVDHVHHVLEEGRFARARQKAYNQLKGEPDYTECLNDEEGRVKVPHPLFGVAEQSLWKLGEGFQLCLEPEPGYVDDHPLAAFVVIVVRGIGVLRVSRDSRGVVHVISCYHGHFGRRRRRGRRRRSCVGIPVSLTEQAFSAGEVRGEEGRGEERGGRAAGEAGGGGVGGFRRNADRLY